MTKKQHIAQHKKLHASLLLLIADWQACSNPEAYREPAKRSIHSLLEWSERQLENPEEATEQPRLAEGLPLRRRFSFIFKTPKP